MIKRYEGDMINELYEGMAKYKDIDLNTDFCRSEDVAMLEAELLEMAKAIVDRHEEYDGDFATCVHCGNGNWGQADHDEDCIVNKANKYIEVNNAR